MIESFGGPEFAAFANHLAFLAQHRGELRSDPTGIWIDGASPALTCWTPWPGTVLIPAGCPAVRLGPGADSTWPNRLVAAGFSPAERLSYMELDTLSVDAKPSRGIHIDIARTDAALREFAAVQAVGFATDDPAVDAWWAPFFVQAALRNQFAGNQKFYLARAGSEPAATTLALRAAGVTGIYAVATHPAYRRRGLARALLHRACADAAGEGEGRRVVLQAMTGSYAEHYYRKLGFRTAYELQVWRRTQADT